MIDFFELVTARLTDANGLAAEPRLEVPDRLVLRDLRAGETGAGRNPVRHRVGDQFRPALTPQIVGDLGAVGIGYEPADFMRPLGDRAVHFAGAVDGVRGTALHPPSMD